MKKVNYYLFLMLIPIFMLLSSCGGGKEGSRSETDSGHDIIAESVDSNDYIDEIELSEEEIVTADDISDESEFWYDPITDDDLSADNAEVAEDNSDTSKSSGSNDIDSYLDQYEKCMNQYIALMKRVQNGDQSVYMEYATYLKEIQKLSEKGDKLKGEMTASQINRLQNIVTKMTSSL